MLKIMRNIWIPQIKLATGLVYSHPNLRRIKQRVVSFRGISGSYSRKCHGNWPLVSVSYPFVEPASKPRTK